MTSPTQQSRVIRASDTCRRLGITQSQIAEALGVSQGQISRILRGKIRRVSRLFKEACLFVERMDCGVSADAISENDDLINALMETWNGSSAHAKALAAVIRSTKALAAYEGGAVC